MKIKEYIEKASETAIYPYKDDFWGLDYCITGLVGECGEVYNKLKKSIRSDNWELKEDKKNELAGEIGGCFWYVSQCLRELKVQGELLEISVDTFGNEIHQQYKDSFDSDYTNDVIRLKLLMNKIIKSLNEILLKEESFFANIGSEDVWKDKEARDKESNEFAQQITQQINLIFSCLCIFSKEMGYDVNDVMQRNLDVLKSRQERDVIEGNGDNR